MYIPFQNTNCTRILYIRSRVDDHRVTYKLYGHALVYVKQLKVSFAKMQQFVVYLTVCLAGICLVSGFEIADENVLNKQDNAKYEGMI